MYILIWSCVQLGFEEAVVKRGVNEYHLIGTPVFTPFKPPSAQSEPSRMGGGSTSADVSRKYFVLKSRQL